MRRIIVTSIAVLFACAAFAAVPKTATLDVQNMYCELCPITVKKSLEGVTGVTEAKIDFEHKTATVTFDPDKVTPAALIKATTNAGFPSSVRK
ncbi:MAG: mercury resistance system periplasmic binding protein MerP [Betaproteobacteria bacterium]|nr:MAG: mercury resistance system periplasmic binding protein MerP [Betaproteobacteria bacterium]